MRFRLTFLLLVFPILAISAASQTPPSQDASAHQPNLRRVVFDVIDKSKGPSILLQPEDVRLLENDKPQKIVSLSKLEDQQMAIALMIDTSVSQERTLAAQKLAADAFVQTVMQPGKDQAALITFTVDKTIEQAFTSDVALLREAISRTKVVVPAGYVPGGIVIAGRPSKSSVPQLAGATALWDVIYTTADNLFSGSPANHRRVLVLLSDGNDTASRAELRDAIKHVVNAGVEVHAIGIGDEQMGGVNKDALRKLSEKTGGEAFFPEKVKDLAQVFAQIKQALRSRYEVTYHSSMPPAKNTKLKVEVINPALRPKDLRVRYPPLDAPSR